MITKLGHTKLEERLIALKVELDRTLQERSAAAAEGDLSENSAYLFMGERAEVLRSQIGDISTDLRESTIQSAPAQNRTIAFGHLIELLYLSDGHKFTLVLVGKNDARLKPNWISNESPLGIALLAKKIGDVIQVNDQSIKIVSIDKGDI